MDKNLIGASINLLLLSILEKEDMYGYEIIKQLDHLSDHTFTLKEGTLYPVLHKLESKGYIQSYKASSDKGRTRKYYKLTRLGKDQLEDEHKKWHQFTSTVNKVINYGSHAYG